MISVRWSLSCTNGSSKQKLSHSGMHLAQQDIDVLLLLIEGNSCEITRDRKSYLDMLISVVSEWLHLTQWPLRPPMSGVTAMSLLCNTRVRRITHHAPSRHSLGFILASHTHASSCTCPLYHAVHARGRILLHALGHYDELAQFL